MADKTDNVRYRVTGICFVGGNLIDPKGDPNVFVWLPPGRAGSALELAPEAPPNAPPSSSPTGPAAPDVPQNTTAAELAAAREQIEKLQALAGDAAAKASQWTADLAAAREQIAKLQQDNHELAADLETAQRELDEMAAAQLEAAQKATAPDAKPPKQK